MTQSKRVICVIAWLTATMLLGQKMLAQVSFADTNLRNAIFYSTSNFSYDPKEITTLDISNFNIKDLRGIEQFTNLTKLVATHNQISDLSPLASLTKLNVLTLNRNRITNLTPIKELKNLIYLDLAENNITSFKGLEHLVSLQYLYIQQNKIAYIPSLKHIVSLKLIRVSYRSGDPKSMRTLDERVFREAVIPEGCQIENQ